MPNNNTAATREINAPIRLKRYARKVKTGCITCRIRRVKCDETKPKCNRCLVFGIGCDGYDSDRGRGERAGVHLPLIQGKRKILPRLEPFTTTNSIKLSQSPDYWRFMGESDHQYFRQFQEHTAPSLAGYFKDSMWSKTILRACHDSPFIMNGVIAMAALDKTSESAREFSDAASSHHRFALKRFSKAVHQMTESLKTSSGDFRSTLVFCLLVVCFEAWNGSMDSAISHIRSGLKMVKSWLDESKYPFSKDDIALINIFNRLENSTVITQQNKLIDSAVHFESHWYSPLAEEIPEVFATLEDALDSHETIMREVIRLVMLSYMAFTASRSLDSSLLGFVTEEDEKARLPENTNFAKLVHDMILRVERWHDAFFPLLEAARKPENSAMFAAATSLELRYRANSRVLVRSGQSGEGMYDAFIEDFKESVRLASDLIKHEKKQYKNIVRIADFTIEGSFLPSLYAVSTKCRDPAVRREAIRLLEEDPHREGLWDSKVMAKVGRTVMEIEEQGMVDGYVPEPARIILTGISPNMYERKGTLMYARMDLDVKSPRYGTLLPQSVDFTW